MADELVLNQPIKLSPGQKKMLEDLGKSIVIAENAIKGLEDGGMNVDVLRQQLETTKKQREAFLKAFG